MILGSGPVRFEGTVVVPNRSNVDRILRSDRVVQGTTSSIALSEKARFIMYRIWSCWDRVSRGAMLRNWPIAGGERTKEPKTEGMRDTRTMRSSFGPGHHDRYL